MTVVDSAEYFGILFYILPVDWCGNGSFDFKYENSDTNI